ncbi:translation initiation factor [Pseudozyma hubeiensis SY62]|uniref:RNA helicase n=1 Tax=Pseudozyma hubeiensis (strain SY62) TaxID=1305764 RepID=R9PC26_PSEHS|nr:translation initiation factor [Pseudozyma hubeiensis SY62]GAC98889.1 translation initiation factor [Pseudozyma hubeiensis SY62]
MSVSPFLPGNSIWSTNAAPTGPVASGADRQSSNDAGKSQANASNREETPRAGAHPLPNKPGAPGRSNSAISARSAGNATAEDAVRSFDSAMNNAALRPGVIGGTRAAGVSGTRGPRQADVGRSNSLAASVNSLRSANSGSPLPAVQAQPDLPHRSPSLQENAAGSHERNGNVSGETEFGTPRLFLDAQHAFDQDDQVAALSFGRPTSALSHEAGNFPSGRPRPNSWMHPASRDIADSTFSRPFSSQGNHVDPQTSQNPETGATFGGFDLASKRSSSAQVIHSPMDASARAAFASAGQIHVGQMRHTSNPTSPGINSGSFGRSNRADLAAAAAGRATPTLAVPSYMNLPGGLLSPTAATLGSGGPPTAQSPVGSPLSASGFPNQPSFRSVSAGYIFDKPSSHTEEVNGGESATIQDMLARLTRVESGMKDFSRQISGISRNVSLLLERTKGLPPASLSNNAATSVQVTAASASGTTAEDVRSLNAQVSALASSVSHLLTLQGNGLGSAGQTSAPSLAGLGLASSGGMLGTPQLGAPNGLDRAASPRIGSNPSGQFNSSAFSPRPSGNNRGWSGPNQNSDRRWNPSTQSGNAHNQGPNQGGGAAAASFATNTSYEEGAAGVGSAFQPGSGIVQPNAVISKWEHLNLHPDLLRSILKYGLGPPNKIQQRALPFLLRGSDIIAQAPPTQERIASYVIPSLQLVFNVLNETGGPGQTASNRGPVALIVSTTVDQATQAQRMALGLGAPLGIRVHMVAASSIDVHQEAQSLVQAWPHIVVGTPQKMSELFTYMTNNASSLNGPGKGPGVSAIKPGEVRLVVLDEVDQLIARNLADHVSTMLQVLPLPTAARIVARGAGGLSPGFPQRAGNAIFSPFDNANESPGGSVGSNTIDRQVALFSNTVPQDVLNFAQSIHLRDSVRVLVRRDGAGGGAGGSSTMPSGPGGSSIMGEPHGAGLGPQMPSSQRDLSQPTNALGAHPVNSSISTTKDGMLSALKGLRQYYLYVAVTSGGGMGAANSAQGVSHNPASEMKLDLISDLLEDIDFGQTVIYCSNVATQEALIYKLSSKGIESLGLNREMNSYTRQQTLAKFRSALSQFGNNHMVSSDTFAAPNGYGGVNNATIRPSKALVVCDMAVNPKEVHQVPLVVFYDMPRSVEEYKDKISCAAAGGMARPSVCVNVVTASGGPRGDVEMLRTLEVHLGCKMAELPMDSKQILNF